MTEVFPKISVVTISFNQGAFLEQTILSVINQNYPNLEYIIIDGGSTDQSVDIIKKYEKHLAYWCSEKDGGMYYALQKGFEKSTGELMCWINSDDMMHQRSLFVAANIFSKFSEVSWIMGMPSVIDENGNIILVKNLEPWPKNKFYDLNVSNHIQQESVFWRKSLWDKAGAKIETRYKFAGDCELWSRFYEYAELYCLRTVLGAFRIRSGNQLSRDNVNEYAEEVKRIKLGNKIADLNGSNKMKKRSLFSLNKTSDDKVQYDGNVILYNWQQKDFQIKLFSKI